ncbi:MAG: hypothetical protein AMJ81_11910 [Phycisphaerae bacterium SM23_33]|nr:MAG: hypothetical protein AMJ81_11910 [Phycisphaerae bacterium SM23_33]
MPMSTDTDNLVASPCCNPEMTLEQALAAYSGLGFRKFEAFTGWVKSALDVERDPQPYLRLARQHGMSFASLHLPPVGDEPDASLGRAIRAAEFAAALGVQVVLFKAASRERYINAARPVLDAAEGLGLTAAVQNHAGTAISTLDDVRAVLAGVADPRLKAVLEVGHFHKAGESWEAARDYLGGRIALVHVKDMVGPRSVPFGTGEIDLPAVFRSMRAGGYEGDYVIEMEVEDRRNTLRYLAEAIEYIRRHCL